MTLIYYKLTLNFVSIKLEIFIQGICKVGLSETLLQRHFRLCYNYRKLEIEILKTILKYSNCTAN